MSGYANYSDYTEYGGKLAEADFNALIDKAVAYVHLITLGRAVLDSEPVKKAVCAVVDVYAANNSGKTIASETNDGYSVTYATEAKSGETTETLTNRKAYQAAYIYLAPLGVLNRKVGLKV